MIARVTRRSVLRTTSAAAVAALLSRRFAAADENETVIPFVEPQAWDPKKPAVHWDALTPDQWITPDEQVFTVGHYKPFPTIDPAAYKLGIEGLVANPRTLTLEQLKSLPKKQITATLECSGNGAGKTFLGAIANTRWTGTPLATLLKECGIQPEAVEVAFWGADKGKEKIREQEYEQNFARTLSIADAMKDDVLLAWEMNGRPLAPGHGFPVRLIVPGYFGIAWVKWLGRIELRDRRLMNRFTARDYVIIRSEPRPDGTTAWKESAVGPIDVKSVVARVTRRKDGTVVISGAAWADSAGVKSVEVKIDNGPWQPATISRDHDEPNTWRFWTFQWDHAKPGEHTLVSRAIDNRGRVQPASDDPAIKTKNPKTYWEANAQWPRQIVIQNA